MADYGIKISRPGFDISTSNAWELVFSSKYNAFKVVSSGSISVSCTTYDSSTGLYYGTGTINHGLSHVPLYWIYADDGTGRRWTSPAWFDTSPDKNIKFQADGYDNQIDVELRIPNSGSAIVTYYIFDEAKSSYNPTFSNDYGIKVSRPGYSVFSSNLVDYLFHSSYNTPKIYTQGTTTLSFSDGSISATATVSHGLSYAPSFQVYFNVDGWWWQNDDSNIGGPPDSSNFSIVYSDTTNLNIEGVRDTSFGTESWSVKYFILVEPLN